jgi:hypothetical protein
MNIPENLSKWQIGVFWLEGIKSAMSVAGFCPTCHKLRMADRGPDQKSRPDAWPMERSKDSAGFASFEHASPRARAAQLVAALVRLRAGKRRRYFSGDRPGGLSAPGLSKMVQRALSQYVNQPRGK